MARYQWVLRRQLDITWIMGEPSQPSLTRCLSSPPIIQNLDKFCGFLPVVVMKAAAF
jgi:hypothetical protein